MISPWPVYREDWSFPKEESDIGIIKDTVYEIRKVRTEMNVAPGKKAAVYIVSDDPAVRSVFENARSFTSTLGYASELFVQADKTGIPEQSVSAVTTHAVAYMPLQDLVDLDKERARLTKELDRLHNECARSNAMLQNENFLAKAPKEKVDAEKEKLAIYEKTIAQVEERLNALK